MTLHTFSRNPKPVATPATHAVMTSAWLGSEETAEDAEKRAAKLRAAVGHYVDVRTQEKAGSWEVRAEIPKFDRSGNERSEASVWLRCCMGLLDAAVAQ